MSDEKLTTRSENYSEWYNQVVLRTELADYAPVRGCMVVRPYGWALWENIQQALDKRFKATGHVNAAFPLLIPMSFFEKEKEHVEGFSPELAVVTHGGGEKLEEPLVVRPTSETIIGYMYSKWVKSYRDLPILINQWANIVRWEMRTRLFLRTSEFLWQEGHTAHADGTDAMAETLRMLEVYRDFSETTLAMPVIAGEKSENERFPGAVNTYSIEAMMQDGKALQSGTSHYLGQNFARAFDVTFQNSQGQRELVYATSWGVSTRLVGGLVMTHSDDAGLVLPPRLAPVHVAVIPIFKSDAERSAVFAAAEEVERALRATPFTVVVDRRDELRPGAKHFAWERKGVPIRIEIGPRDVAARSVVVKRRDLDPRDKTVLGLDALATAIPGLLDEIQSALLARARSFRDARMVDVDSYADLKDAVTSGRFALAHWDGTPESEQRVKEDTRATIRTIPFEPVEPGACVVSGKPSAQRVLFAQAY
jgi:prolyl-tRNA synthetase